MVDCDICYCSKKDFFDKKCKCKVNVCTDCYKLILEKNNYYKCPYCKLSYINNQTIKEGAYFHLVQPYQHHTNQITSNINFYSFALYPE
jgi:hypothetical protein